MLAGLPQFQEGKEAYSLHLGMAQEAINVFQKRRLQDIASVEQVGKIQCCISSRKTDQAIVLGDGAGRGT